LKDGGGLEKTDQGATSRLPGPSFGLPNPTTLSCASRQQQTTLSLFCCFIVHASVITGLSINRDGQQAMAVYLGNGNCKRLLLAIYVLWHDRVLGVTPVDPYHSSKRNFIFIPSRDFLLDKIKRRANIFDVLP
jgi:hypothetical protein